MPGCIGDARRDEKRQPTSTFKIATGAGRDIGIWKDAGRGLKPCAAQIHNLPHQMGVKPGKIKPSQWRTVTNKAVIGATGGLPGNPSGAAIRQDHGEDMAEAAIHVCRQAFTIPQG